MIRETSELKSQDRNQSGMTVSAWTHSAVLEGRTVTAWAVIGLARMAGLFAALALMSTVTQTFAQNPPARESAAVTGASKGSGVFPTKAKVVITGCWSPYWKNPHWVSCYSSAWLATHGGWDQAADGLHIHVHHALQGDVQLLTKGG